MSIPPVYKILSDSELKEWLKYSKDLLSTVDEIIELTPVNASDSTKQKILRFLFMDARTASYDICVLAESMLTNENHINSRSIESANRLLWENTIDYFYIYESDDTVAERRWSFLDITNSIGQSRKNKEKAFRQKYRDAKGGDHWSGKSREEKMNQGMNKNPGYGTGSSFANLINPIFENFNEEVHGNRVVGLYWDFGKRHVYKEVYRRQVSMGLLNVMYFYALAEAHCILTGRGSEAKRFEFYPLNVIKLLSKNLEETRNANL